MARTRIRPSGTNPTLIRRALERLDQEAAKRSAYTILYQDGKSIGDALDEIYATLADHEARIAALEG